MNRPSGRAPGPGGGRGIVASYSLSVSARGEAEDACREGEGQEEERLTGKWHVQGNGVSLMQCHIINPARHSTMKTCTWLIERRGRGCHSKK